MSDMQDRIQTYLNLVMKNVWDAVLYKVERRVSSRVRDILHYPVSLCVLERTKVLDVDAGMLGNMKNVMRTSLKEDLV